MKKLLALASAAAVALTACQKDGAADSNTTAPANASAEAPTGTLAEAIASGNNGKFREAVRAAGLEATLHGPGPYTVLVPSDAAFAKLPAGSVEGLMKPEAKGDLTTVLTYHILPGTILVADLNRAVDNGGGKAVLATMAGKTLTATRDGQNIVLTDEAGNKATITGAEKAAGNGVVHEVDAVLLPSKIS
jgi:uncharacterized surface protein with fasciclin (FAS1) repeats